MNYRRYIWTVQFEPQCKEMGLYRLSGSEDQEEVLTNEKPLIIMNGSKAVKERSNGTTAQQRVAGR